MRPIQPQFLEEAAIMRLIQQQTHEQATDMRLTPKTGYGHDIYTSTPANRGAL